MAQLAASVQRRITRGSTRMHEKVVAEADFDAFGYEVVKGSSLGSSLGPQLAWFAGRRRVAQPALGRAWGDAGLQQRFTSV